MLISDNLDNGRDNENRRNKANISDIELWCYALGAVLFEMNGVDFANNYELEFTEENDALHRQSLERDWGIDSRETLLDNLNFLDDGGHNVSFMTIRSFLSALSASDQQRYIAAIPNATKEYREHRIVQAYMNRLPAAGIAAWDWGRYVNLCKYGAFLGYISRQEALELIMPIAVKAQQCYTGWYEYGTSYLIGRQFWWGQTTEDSAKRMVEYVHRLMIDAGSPWNRLDWNMSLN